MTESVPSFNVTAAFHSQLNTLCIREFPCGYGSWRAPNVSSNVSLKSTGILKGTRSSATVPAMLAENSAELETVENLQELAVKSPYDVDCTWSSEAESLREIAVKTPDKLTEAFILKFFKSLRIVDKKVTDIDDGLLQLKNLKQLTLSANLIRNIDSKRLPKGLEELELAANQISDINPLCVCPPPLIHLGLSYNLISSITGHMKANSWPHLLSLDLSFNNLADLYHTINVLKTLPKLKNLVLQGNPLALVPGYRGYAIDSIRQLTILDDIRISADEKHFFKGLSKLKDVPVDEAQIMVSIKTIKGVKVPPEIEDPEINADYPKTEHRYHVEFQFLKTESTTVLCQSPALSVPTISITGDDAESEALEEGTVWNEDNQTYKNSGGVISKRGTKHMYVVEDPNATAQHEETKLPASAKSRPGSKIQKAPSKEKRKESAKARDKAKDGKGRKNKQDDIELFELPRTRYILGSCNVPLNSLLEGELEVEIESVCEGREETGDSDKKDAASGTKSDVSEKKKQSKDSTDKSSKGNPRAGSPGKAKGGRGRSSKDDKKTKEKDKQEENLEGEEEATHLPPLTIQVQIKLHNWKSAREAVQEFLPQGIPSHAEQN
ncbi:Leucine-rich repeat-containing protein 43 [Stylophora pistillata]|uniref:Leucine-rich repeat-containing protein 43 n=1 Tax=Stylophora pistillata TaxID=50429 RepID=A0A2B4SJ05_STYPI|nr:Leucine-rich repeat-containing protein 43 [Stylophora pistillata]